MNHNFYIKFCIKKKKIKGNDSTAQNIVYRHVFLFVIKEVTILFYSEDLIEEVRSKNDIVDVISGYIKLQKKGNNYFGLCPFHNEKSPSFSVSRSKQMYHCFGCGVGGNVFTFVMEYENYSFLEALQMLADRAGVELPKMEYSKEQKEKADLKSSILEVNKIAGQYFYMQLKGEGGAHAREYLSKRGLDNELIKSFGLGYSNKYSDDLYRFLKGRGYSEDIIREAGLISTSEKNGVYDKFWNRVMFPIMDVNNRVIGFGGRVMGDGKPKYLNSPETLVFDKSRNLYGINRARQSRRPYFLLCEGYMDVISLHQAGFTNAVASLGTAFTPGHAHLIKRYVSKVYITYDSDEAGTKAALRAMPILRAAGIACEVIRMDPYKDPDEFIKNAGVEEFEKRIEDASNGFMFSIDVLSRDYDMNSPEDKTAFFKEAASRLVDFEDELERNNYTEAVAKRYKVSTESLTKLVAKIAVLKGMATPVVKPKSSVNEKKKDDGMLHSQKLLLTWLIEEGGLYDSIKNYIGPKDFTEDILRTVATLLFEQLESGDVNPAKILNHFTDSDQHKEAASLFNTKISRLSSKKEEEQAIIETLLKVKNNSIAYRTRNLDPSDMPGLQELVKEKQKLAEISKIRISI